MSRVRTLTVFLAVFLWTASAPGNDARITLTTLNWEPYIGESLKNHGYLAEIVREAFKRQGYKVTFRFMPWARAAYMAQKGSADGYFPVYYSRELKKHCLMSAPIRGGPIGFFKLKSTQIDYKTLPDLKTYTIGVGRGYINTTEFDAADYLNKDDAVDDLTNFKKLLMGRVDLVIGDWFVGCHIIRHQLQHSQDKIEFMPPPLETKQLYICFSKKHPRAEKIRNDFNQGLKQLKNEGAIEKIMAKHGFQPLLTDGKWIAPCQ